MPSQLGPARRDLADELARWVSAGLLSHEEADGIADYERACRAAVPVEAPGPARRIPVVAEALGYLGGVLGAVGLVLVVARSWPDMAIVGRLALSGAAALALLGAGALVHEEGDAGLARLRGVLWLASTAAAALFAGVVAADGLGTEHADTIVLACSGTVAVLSGLLWWGRSRPLQQLTFLAGVVVFSGALVAEVAAEGPTGLAVWVVGALLTALGLRRRTPKPLLTEGVGTVAAVVGTLIAVGGWQGFGLVFAVATAGALLALAAVPGLVPSRGDAELTGIVGGVALLQTTPGALVYFGQDAGVVTGLTTWTVGAVVLLVGARRLVRLPVLAEVVGAFALLGGAALTGVQWPGLAPVVGIGTAVGLIGLGMLPGQVLLSVFGSFGLLVNVPWAIAWYFPGEGRAPLLVLASGAVILAVAVLLTRMGGRFRRELGGPSRRGTPPPRVVPGKA